FVVGACSIPIQGLGTNTVQVPHLFGDLSRRDLTVKNYLCRYPLKVIPADHGVILVTVSISATFGVLDVFLLVIIAIPIKAQNKIHLPFGNLEAIQISLFVNLSQNHK